MQAIADLCPICNSGPALHFGVVDEYALSRCETCGHLYLPGGVSENLLAESYGADYYGYADAGSAKLGYDNYLRDSEKRIRGFRHRLSTLERFVSPPARLLDFGCAVGLFVRVAQERGWQAIGYDRSEWAASYGRKNFGVDIRSGDLPAFAEGSFDLVTLWDCIEHLTNPREVVSRIRYWLEPGGLLAVNTVNSSSLGARLAGRRWRHIAPPLHIHLFSAQSLQKLLVEQGFSILVTRGEGVMLGARKMATKLAWPIRVCDDLICHWRLSTLTTRLNFRDEIYVLARKNGS